MAEDPVPPVSDAQPRSGPSLPAESPTFITYHRRVLTAFWFVVLALGIPHWVWTTSIHRSSLPLHQMNEWAQGQACQLDYPLRIRLEGSGAARAFAPQLATEVETILRSDSAISLGDVHVQLEGSETTVAGEVHQAAQSRRVAKGDHALTVQIRPEAKGAATSAQLWTWLPLLEITYDPGRPVDESSLAPLIAHEVQKVFANERDSIHYILEQTPFAGAQSSKGIASETRQALDSRYTRAFKYASTYHLTFSLFTSSATPSAWQIEEALNKTMKPLLNQLNSISQFTVDTQVQLYASFSPSIAGPLYNESTKEWKLQKSDLSGFINAAEWPLSPGIGAGPTINFVLFVPSKEQRPLVVAETRGNSWLIPQWGGVQILNPSGEQPEVLTIGDLEPVMLTFADQLASLIGLPSSPDSLSLRISSLTRERAVSLIVSASSTLGALARLTHKLTSIAIPDSVAKSVDETVYRLEEACADLHAGRYLDALNNARTAEDAAEKAFFEPSMVGQVYFPDEHKVAVYVPLLGPMAVPLVMAAVKELSVILRRWREKKAKRE